MRYPTTGAVKRGGAPTSGAYSNTRLHFLAALVVIPCVKHVGGGSWRRIRARSQATRSGPEQRNRGEPLPHLLGQG